MAGKKIILSKNQIDEIIGYCDGDQQDLHDNGGIEVSVGDNMENGYADPFTTDDIADMRSSDIGGLWKDGGACRNVVLRETVFDRLKKFIQGDSQYNVGKFKLSQQQMNNAGPITSKNSSKYTMQTTGVDKKNLPELNHRAEEAIEKAKNGDDTMAKNMGGLPYLNYVVKGYKSLKASTQAARKTKQEAGQKIIHRETLNANNGKAHSEKKDNNNITYFD